MPGAAAGIAAACATASKILLHGIRKFALERCQRCHDLSVRSRRGAEPKQGLHDGSGIPARPFHHFRAGMAEMKEAAVYFHGPRRPVGDIEHPCRHGVGQAESICPKTAVAHDADIVSPCQGIDHQVRVDRSPALQDAAPARKVIESMSDPPQIAVFARRESA